MNLLVTAWRYAKGKNSQYLWVYGCFCITNCIEALRPLLYGWFINAIQKNGINAWVYVWKYVLAYLGLNFILWSIHGPARVMERSLAFHLSRNYLLETYRLVLHSTVKWHQNNHSGAITNRIRKAYEALQGFFENGFFYFQTIGKFVLSLVAMVYFSPLFGSIGIVLGVITVWLIFKFDKPMIASLTETHEREHIVAAGLSDGLSNIETVITLRLEQQMEKNLDQKVEKVFAPFIKYVRFNEWKWFTADTMVAIIYCVVTIGYVLQYKESNATFYVGGLVTLLLYVNQFTSVFQDIAQQYNQIIQYNSHVVSVQKIKDSFAVEKVEKEVTSGNLPYHEIEIRNLNFSHLDDNGREKSFRLQNIHLMIKRGMRIALIGESGSGKSTLLTLLRGLQPTEPGVSLAVDGQLYNNLKVIGDVVTLLPQEPAIFENTIRFNITLGLSFDDSEILEVCRIANFTEVLNLLPNGLDTSIREKGVNLSGGQKQRLALARGLLAARYSSLLLLDEPTSSVDLKGELIIYKNIFSEFKSKAIISTLHRLSLLSYFDYIYILHGGRIIGEGTFGYLEENSHAFRELLNTGKIISIA